MFSRLVSQPKVFVLSVTALVMCSVMSVGVWRWHTRSVAKLPLDAELYHSVLDKSPEEVLELLGQPYGVVPCGEFGSSVCPAGGVSWHYRNVCRCADTHEPMSVIVVFSPDRRVERMAVYGGSLHYLMPLVQRE